jgi:hypothetical protein
MEAGLIPNWLQGPPVAIVCSQAFAPGLLLAGGGWRQRIKEHDEEPGKPGPSD